MLVTDIAHAQQGAQQAAQQGADPPVLDGIAQAFRTAALTWRPRLIPLAQRTFALLAALEFAVSGIEAAFRRDGMDAIAAKFLLKFTLISVLLTLITTFDFWVPPIINGFVAAGAHAGDQPGFRPLSIVARTRPYLVHRAAPGLSCAKLLAP
jgi:hypothetical protein